MTQTKLDLTGLKCPLPALKTRKALKSLQPGDYSQTYVGDETDTSPYPDPKLMGISIEAYVRNMGILIRALDATK